MKKLLIVTTIALAGCAGPQLRTADTGYSAQGAGPNYWDKLQAVRAQGGGGISALLTAGLGTGAGWAPGMRPPQLQPVQSSHHSYQFGTDLPVNCTTTGNTTHCM
jgi:hypothetical protein